MAASISREPAGLDYLALLKAELIGHVRRARGAFGPAGQGAAVCVDAVQQVEGVLRTLGLERLALLAEALAQVARTLPALPDERQEEVIGILRNGLDQLRDGIEHRAAGRPEPVWELVAALNELRGSLALPLVSEVCLFAPGLEEAFAGALPPAEGAGRGVEEAARQERAVLHRGLYLWYSGREPERGLRKLRRVADNLRRIAATDRLQRLFLILEAMVVVVADGPVAASGAIRRVLAGVDQLLKRLGEVGEYAVAGALPLDLVRNLLFQVATSGSAHRVVRAVREGSDLRLVIATGCDGRDQAAGLLVAEAARLRHRVVETEQDGASGHALTSLAAAVQRLSDALALAELGDQRSRLVDPLEALHRAVGGGGAVSDPLPELDEALGRVEGALRAYARGGLEEPAPAAPASELDVAAAEMAGVEEEVAAVDQEIERSSMPSRASAPVAAPDVAPLDEDIREMFLDEAAEKVEAMRQHYVGWSAQRDDGAALDAVLVALDGLKSTGRLVGADTISEVCWVLEAALRGCRDGTVAATDEALAVLDAGIEMVDALVGAHVRGTTVEGDPRSVEQRIYALLTPAAVGVAPTPIARPPTGTARLVAPEDVPDSEAPVLDADTFEGDFDLVELFAEEAGDLADALEEGLRGLEQDPARSAWLMEMRRALRALAAAARHAELPQLNALCEAFDGFLARAAEAGTGVGPDALGLTREATGAVAGVVESLRSHRLPHLPPDLIDRLREASPRAASPPAPTDAASRGPSPPAAAAGESGSEESLPLRDPASAQRIIERASGAGVCHLQIEDQVAVLREQVGRLEGVLALLHRLPASDAGGGLPPRVAAALADLDACAHRMHETSLTISAQLRAQGHHLTGLQQGLAEVFAGTAGPRFSDLLLVGIGDAVYAVPATVIDSVRRLAPDLIPPDGELLDLRGRAFVYHHLADLLAERREAPAEAGRAQSVVLARAHGRAVALGVDRVIGHRTLLVATPGASAGDRPWLGGLASLGGEREAVVVDLEHLLAGA